MLALRVTPTIADTALLEAFVEAQHACYGRFGVAGVAPAAARVAGLSAWLVSVHGADGALLAGVRVEGRRPLPVERALAHPALSRRLAALEPEGVAELCGLWAAPDLAGRGIGGPVIAAAVAVAPSLGFAWLCSFAHDRNRF